jgi:probable F420-dependent oxidoreductase
MLEMTIAHQNAPMTISLGITNMLTSRSLSPTRLAGEVEARGFDALYFAEHSHIPASRLTRFPGASQKRPELPDRYWHLTGQLTAMAMAVAVTERLIVGSSVCLIAQHDPIWLAKELATIDHVSGGRLELGIGFGWNREEYEAHGLEWPRRHTRAADCVGTMRALWTDHEASWEGTEFALAPSWSYPKTVRTGGPKILFGTGTGPKARAAMAEWGDGWMPILVPGLDLRAELDNLRGDFAAAGRDPAELSVVAMNAPHDVAALHELEELGVQRAAFTVWGEEPDDILRELDVFAATAAQM